VTGPFPAHAKPIQLAISRVVNKQRQPVRTVDCSLRQALQAVGEGTLLYDTPREVLNHAAKLLLGKPEENDRSINFDFASEQTLRRELVLNGLIEIVREDRPPASRFDFDSPPSAYLRATPISELPTIWKLTDYGRRQLAAIAP